MEFSFPSLLPAGLNPDSCSGSPHTHADVTAGGDDLGRTPAFIPVLVLNVLHK